jgi:hypothetical protein
MATTIKTIMGALDEALSDAGLERRGSGGAVGGLGMLVTGLALGTVAGLLMAPESGAQLRQRLAQQFNGWREDVESKMRSVAGQSGRYNPPS